MEIFGKFKGENFAAIILFARVYDTTQKRERSFECVPPILDLFFDSFLINLQAQTNLAIKEQF